MQCNFEFLLQLVNRQLDLDRQLEAFNHLDRCNICRDAVYQLSHDLDRVSFTCGTPRVPTYTVRRNAAVAESGRAQACARAGTRNAVARRSSRLQ
jgi:hypothetical protein